MEDIFSIVNSQLKGGTLGSIDIRLPFYAAAALSLVNAVYGLLVLPESLPRERRKAIERHLQYAPASVAP